MIEERFSKLRKILKKHDLSNILISNPSNVFYLSGSEGLEAKLLFTPNSQYLFTDSRYIGQAKSLSKLFHPVIIKKKFSESLGEILIKKKIKKLVFEAKDTSVYILDYLKKQIPMITWKPSLDVVETLREIKDSEEISKIKKACGIVDRGFHYIEKRIQLGMTEKAIAWELEKFFRESGADDRSFKFIIASGKNSWIPHYKTAARKIKKGDILLIDAGVKYQGYCSDCTRTFMIEPVSIKARDLYKIVLKAQLTALNNLKAGIKAKKADAFARDIVTEEAKHDFRHGTGHGVGIEIHERPNLSFLNEKGIVQENSVVTVEPGIYLENFGGIRIEDTVLVQKNKSLRLTKSSKDLKTLKI